MKIADVTPMVMGTAWRNLTIVRVRTDDGLEGVGEVRMVNHTQAVLGYLAHAIPTHVLGADPFEIEALVQRMWRNDYERAGGTVMSGIAAVEIACWDIVGKALGQPVHRLLGGAVRPRLKAYANGWYTVERTPEEFHAAARRVVERGYRALKLDPFGAGSFELTPDERRRAVALVEAVRAAIGPDAELLVEMHGRFTPATAIAIARELEPFAPSWIEEPVPPENLAALEKVSRRVHLPVATGERIHVRHEFRELLERQAADVIQPDVTTVGGILEARKIAAWAESHYVLVAPHNVGGPISTAAALHLAACTPNFKIQEHFNDFAEAHVKLAAPGNPEVVDGHFAVPTAPGLGVTLDEDVVRANPMRQLHFDLFADDWHFRQAAGDVAVR
ncbi:MAG TPA: mandelate racemase/muconate lactonizing enzyme family protein [Candidatus Dormibacteraeota bacterium]|nr:mandelate racemase/muconate lactonizing enzyme family protein [Candidatus Dormibacteraeota bacterium]